MKITEHHDDHGLNERLVIDGDEGRYNYTVRRDNGGYGGPDAGPLASIAFQSQNPADGVNGITDECLLVILLDRARAWKKGPLHTPQNELVIRSLEDALTWKQHRADDRAERGVLGSRDK